jgi:hypothetical protein
MKKYLLILACSGASIGAAWGEERLTPGYLHPTSAAEFVGGTAPASGGAFKVGELRWKTRSSKSTASLEQQVRRALEDAAAKVELPLDDSSDAATVSTVWEASSRNERMLSPELSEADRSAKCVERGPDVGRMVAGVVGWAALGLGQSQTANMIASGARAGNEPLQWQRYSHLANADRVVCGRGEYVLETKVTVSGAAGSSVLFAVRSALPGGASPAEAVVLIGQNAQAIALELKAMQSGACDRAIRCGAAVATTSPATQ